MSLRFLSSYALALSLGLLGCPESIPFLDSDDVQPGSDLSEEKDSTPDATYDTEETPDGQSDTLSDSDTDSQSDTEAPLDIEFDTDSDVETDTEPQPPLTCPAGEYVHEESCKPCPDGHYCLGGTEEPRPWSVCDPDTQTAYAPGTAFADAQCCFQHDGDINVTDGQGWPALDKGNCLILNGTLNLSGSASSSFPLVKVTQAVVVSNYQGPHLEALSSLQETTDLAIWGNPLLTHLEGLEQLHTIHESLRVQSNSALVSIAGLSRLSSVKYAEFSNNNSLQTFDGLTSFEMADSTNLVIHSNASLSSLEGLANLRRIKELALEKLPLLPHLDELSSLEAITDRLNLRDLPLLTSITSLSGLQAIDTLSLQRLPRLSSLEGFHNLNTVGNFIEIHKLDALSSLEGLRNLRVVTDVIILEELAALPSLAGLEQLQQVNKLHIKNSPGLQSLTGLQGLTEVGEDLILNNLSNLHSISALSNLTRSGFDIRLINLPQLVSLEGLID